jgi:hypothetical protein
VVERGPAGRTNYVPGRRKDLFILQNLQGVPGPTQPHFQLVMVALLLEREAYSHFHPELILRISEAIFLPPHVLSCRTLTPLPLP